MRTRASVLALVVTSGAVAALAVPATTAAAAPEQSRHRPPSPVGHTLPKVPVMTGGGGAVASVDPVASQVGIDILKRGGTAADAAVATAAAVATVEPYSSGIGGGGFFVHYDSRTRKVSTLDGRETAPATFTDKVFLRPDGTPMDFNTVVNSGLSVGTPGTAATWDKALKSYGRMNLNQVLKPAQEIAERGFRVDETFHQDTLDNAQRFAMFPATAKIYLLRRSACPGRRCPAQSRPREGLFGAAAARHRVDPQGADRQGHRQGGPEPHDGPRRHCPQGSTHAR